MRDSADGDAARGLGAHVISLDVTASASVDAAVALLPDLDVLVNNAGILGTASGVDDLSAEAMAQRPRHERGRHRARHPSRAAVAPAIDETP